MYALTINFPNDEMRKTFVSLMETGGLEEDIIEGLEEYSYQYAPKDTEEYDINFDYSCENKITITIDT